MKRLLLRRREAARRELARIRAIYADPQASAKLTDADRKRLLAKENIAAFRYQLADAEIERERQGRPSRH